MEHSGARVTEYEITEQEYINLEQCYQVERGVKLSAEVDDYLNIYRSLDAKYQTVSMEEFDALSLTASSTGLMEVTLVKASIDKWSEQPRTQLRMNGQSELYELSRSQFTSTSSDAARWDDLVMIVFTLINGTGEVQNFEVEISDVVFQRLSATSNEELEEVLTEANVNPNPVSDVMTLSFTSPRATMATVEIYNSIGKQVNIQSMAAATGLNLIEIDCSDMPCGAYTYKIAYGNKLTYTGKLIKI